MTLSKVVLITGCSSGFGYELALRFAREGNNTYASVRNLEKEGSKKLLQIAKEEKLQLHVIHIDVTDDSSIQKAVGDILKNENKIDILINNAGFGFLGAVEDFTINEVEQQYNTNIFGTLRMIKMVVPSMREQKNGLIINLSSINGVIPLPLWGVYSSSKFAIETLSEALHFELSRFGIKVVIVEPGSFLTNFQNNIKHPDIMKTTHSPYKKMTDSFFNMYYKKGEVVKDTFISRFINTKKIVNKIYNISQNDNPNLRYRIGIDANIMFVLKRILPETIWQFILHKVYKW